MRVKSEEIFAGAGLVDGWETMLAEEEEAAETTGLAATT